MSIPFSPTRPDPTSEANKKQKSSDEQAAPETSLGGDGAPIMNDGEPDFEGNPSLSADGSSIEQIRDILFGRQMGAYEERFTLLENRFQEATEALRQEIKERLDSLDAHFREEADALGRRVTQERDVRSEAVDELVTSVRQHRDSLGKRIEEVEKAATESADALNTQVLSEAKRAQEALESRTGDLRRVLDENIAALGDGKADRHALATLLADMASRLSEGDESA